MNLLRLRQSIANVFQYVSGDGIGIRCRINQETDGYMCLGIPMQVIEVDRYVAHCEAKGVQRDVNLFLMQEGDVQPGDFVMVHVGYAIQKMSPEDARSAWELYDMMLADTGAPRA